MKNTKKVVTNDVIDAIEKYTLTALSNKYNLTEGIYNHLSLALFQNQIESNLDDAHRLAKIIIRNIQVYDSALVEAIADIFMIKFIGITSEEFYLNLVVDYLKYKNIHKGCRSYRCAYK